MADTEKRGRSAIESLLLCALIMVAAIGGLTAIGNSLSETFEAAPVVVALADFFLG